MTTLQERLKIALKMARISQSELARRVKLSRGAVSLWFVGSTKELSGSNLLAAAEALDVNPSWLASGRGMKLGAADKTFYGVSKKDFDFISRVNELPDGHRQTLEIMLAELERLLTAVSKQKADAPEMDDEYVKQHWKGIGSKGE